MEAMHLDRSSQMCDQFLEHSMQEIIGLHNFT